MELERRQCLCMQVDWSVCMTAWPFVQSSQLCQGASHKHYCIGREADFEQEQEPPGLGSLTPLGPRLQPLICLLHRHELVPALGVLVRVILPCQLPALHHVCNFPVLATLDIFDAITDAEITICKGC